MPDDTVLNDDQVMATKATTLQIGRELRKFFSLLNAAEKSRVIILFGLLLVSALVEIGTIASLPIYVGLISDPEFVLKQGYVIPSQIFSGYSAEDIILYGGVIIVLLFVVRTCISISVLGFQQFVVFSFFKRIFTDLFVAYLHAPLSHHLETHSSFALRNFNRGIPVLAVGLLNPMLNLGLNFFLLLGVSGFILWQEPYLAGTVLLSITLILLSFNKWTTRRVKIWGDRGQNQHQKSMKIMQDSFSAIQDIKLGSKEFFYEERLGDSINIQTDSARKATFINMIAPSVTEMLAVISIFLLLGYLFLTSQNFVDGLPIITLFIVGIMRLKTYASGIIQAFSKISFNVAVVDSIVDDLNDLSKTSVDLGEKKRASDDEISFSKSLNVESISFSFDSQSEKILKDLSFKLKTREKIAVVGTSGSGKTTLLRVLAGLLPKTSGEILSDGKAVDSDLRKWFSIFGFLQQNTSILDDSIAKNIALGIAEHKIDYDRVEEMIDLCGLRSYVSGLDAGLTTEIGENGARLSGGQRQRIGLARALYKESKILLFDEPTSSLDVETERAFIEALFNIIHEKQISLIMVTHRLETLKYCDKVYRLVDGKLIKLDPPFDFV